VAVPTPETKRVDRQVGALRSGLYARDAGEGTVVVLPHPVAFRARGIYPRGRI